MFWRLEVQTTNDATLPDRSAGKKGYQFGFSKFYQRIYKNANLTIIGIFVQIAQVQIPDVTEK